MAQEITEDRIKERAHQIWEQEGRRDGDNESHWQRAREELQQEGLRNSKAATADEQAGNHVPVETTPSGGAASGVDGMARAGKSGKGIEGLS